MRTNWEYDPVPRYYFFLGEICFGEVIFDGFQPASCNDFSNDGEVWRAIVDEELIGHFGTLEQARNAVRSQTIDRGLTLINGVPS